MRAIAWGTIVALVAAGGTAAADVSGTVVDADGAPVAGARVAREGTGAAVLTDADGHFTLAGSGMANVVAAAKGYFHASSHVTGPMADLVLTLEAVPLDDDPAAELQSPVSCGLCHVDQYASWTDSPMSLAGANTWVYDLYDGTGSPGGAEGFVYRRDSIHAGSDPDSECASCHQPETWAREPFVGLLPIEQADQQQGVSCEVCHRIADIDESQPNAPGLYPGVVRMARPSIWQPIMFGALGDVAFANASMRPSYQPQLTAAVCAACHQDKNDPDGDGNFDEPDGVISEPTYLEWLASSYADPASPDHATCAGCHMAATGAASACAVYTPMIPRGDGQIRSHRIEGTTAAFLEAAVTARVDAQVDGDRLRVDVEVENDRTGHSVPTGVTTRNVILLVEARRERDGRALEPLGDQVVAELGGVGDPADGYYAGLPGKLYAKIPAGADGATPVFYTEAAAIAVDNRIPAHGVDRTSYEFALPDGGGAITVEAKVIYRRAFRALVDAKGWTTDGHGAPLEDVQAPDFGHRMATAEITVDAPGDGDDTGCGCQGGGGGTGLLAAGIVAMLAQRRLRR